MIERTLTTNAKNILSMVACASDYGHDNQIFMHFAAHMLGTLTREECEEYAKNLASQPGYTEEDYEQCLERLTKFLKTSFEDGIAR